MDSKQLLEWYEKQLKIEEKATKEFKKFKKSNNARRFKAADKLYLKTRALKLKFDRNHAFILL